MNLLCPHCARTLRIPTEKARPEVKVQCPGCRKVFALAEAAPAPAAPRGPAAPQAPAPQPSASPQAQAAPPAAPPAAAAADTAAGGAASPRRRARGPRPGAWRTCAHHSGKRSEGVCSECGKGWCSECVKRQGTAAICPECDALCVSTADREKAERVARQRRRPLRDELGTVLTYPLRDPVAYIMMALVVGAFSVAAKVAAFGGLIGIVFYYGFLYAYAFTAINRVSAGNTTDFMPNIGDINDLLKQVFLGVAAMIVSIGPLILLVLLGLGAALAMIGGGGGGEPVFDQAGAPPELREMLQEQGMSEEEIAEIGDGFGTEGEEGDTPYSDSGVSAAAVGTGIGVLIAFAFAALWALLYSPIALIAAAISQSFFATLNPMTGIDAIRRMGSIYWEAWLIYTGIAIIGGIVASIVGIMPFLGSFLAAFVEAYSFLSFGCLLGFAVYKRAEELGVD